MQSSYKIVVRCEDYFEAIFANNAFRQSLQDAALSGLA